MAYLVRRGGGFVLGALLSAACGGGAEGNSSSEPVVVPFSGVQPISPAPADVAPPAEPPAEPPVPEPVPLEPEDVEPKEPAVAANGCQTPSGVSGSPRTLPEAVDLLNALPRPTTLACFIQALERPLRVYMTRSNQSLQPSPGARSPRIFVVNEPMVMSIVLEGEASETLELGYRTTETRSIKTELVFPLQREVNFVNLFDGVLQDGNDRVTRCSQCHTSETQFFDPVLQANVFESDLYPPFEIYEVDVPSMITENESCDAAAEPDRCDLLSALFDHGEVVAAPNGISFSL